MGLIESRAQLITELPRVMYPLLGIIKANKDDQLKCCWLKEMNRSNITSLTDVVYSKKWTVTLSPNVRDGQLSVQGRAIFRTFGLFSFISLRKSTFFISWVPRSDLMQGASQYQPKEKKMKVQPNDSPCFDIDFELQKWLTVYHAWAAINGNQGKFQVVKNKSSRGLIGMYAWHKHMVTFHHTCLPKKRKRKRYGNLISL